MKPSPSVSRRWPRYGLLGLFSLLVFMLMALYLAPALALSLAARWYSAQGEGYRLQAGDWQFAPFQTRLRLQDIELLHPGQGKGVTRLAALQLDLNPAALWQRRLQLTALQVRGLALHLQADDQHLQLAGLTLPLASKASTADAASDSSWSWQLEQLTLQQTDIRWQLEQTAWQGAGQLQLQALSLSGLNAAADTALSLALSLNLPQLQLSGPAALQLQQPLTLELQGQIVHPFRAPQWQGNVQLQALSLQYRDWPLVQVHEIQLHELLADQNAVQLQQLQLADIRLGDEAQPWLHLPHYQATGVQLQQDDEGWQLALGQHEYSGLVLSLQRDAQGQLLGIPRPATGTAAEVTAATAATQPRPHGQIVLQSLQQQEQTDATPPTVIHLTDASVTPPLQSELVIQSLRSGAADLQLGSQGPQVAALVPVSLQAVLDQFGRLRAEGELGVFVRDGQAYPQGRVQLQLRQIDLVAFNGYLARAIGYQVERGSLDADADISLQQAQLGGEVALLLRNSRLVPVDEAVIARVSKQLSMPVETALDLLRDDHGNIRLTVPLSGDLTDPQLGLGDLSRQLSRLALQTGALYFLGQALQPYGTLLSLASYAGDYLLAIRLDALTFAEHDAQLTAEHQAHLQKLATLLQSKAQLEVQACPFVSAAEVSRAGDDWPRLARQRGQAVKQWLLQYDAAVADRVSLCRPQQGKRPEVVLGVR